MELQQIQIHYHEEADRLLLKFAFTEASSKHTRSEIHCWLTRRLCLRIWPALLEILLRRQTLRHPHAQTQALEDDLLALSHAASLNTLNEAGNFATPYADLPAHWPLGETPLLIQGAHLSLVDPEQIDLTFEATVNQRFTLGLSGTIVHAMAQMLQNAVQRADWGFILEWPGSTSAPPGYALN